MAATSFAPCPVRAYVRTCGYRNPSKQLNVLVPAGRKVPVWVRASSADADPDISNKKSSTLKSLESLLGSADDIDISELDLPPITQPQLLEASLKLRPKDRRVRPVYVYVIYYLYIVVYLSYAWLEYTEGTIGASMLRDTLVNDHLAVAAGEVSRLATNGFIMDGPFQLFLLLATLLTVGCEAEAVLGYGLFWAVYWLALMSGSLADAALAEMPITYGPANAAAGMVGALAAYLARNWELEAKLEEAQMALRRRLLAPGQAVPEALQLSEEEVEVLPFIKFSVRLNTRTRGLANALIALVVAGEGLLDFGEAMSSASWVGLVASFWAGMLLTWGAGPCYKVELTQDPQQQQEGGEAQAALGTTAADSGAAATSASSVANGAAAQPSASSTSSATAGGGQAAAAPLPPAGRLRVVDATPLIQKQFVFVLYSMGLGCAITAWLLWMGYD